MYLAHLILPIQSLTKSNRLRSSYVTFQLLIKMGYAIKALGWQKIILVMNTAFGKPEELPFDLRMRRAIKYYMPQETEERATERKKLEVDFTAALRTILEGLDVQTPGEVIQPVPIGEQARLAVENS